MDVHVRKARVGDSPGIARIQVDAYRAAYEGIVPHAYLARFTWPAQCEAWRDWIATNQRAVLLVAEDAGGSLTGYATGLPLPRSSPEFQSELSALYVRPRFWRMGVGRALFAAVVQRMQRLGCGSLLVWVLAENRNACAYYAHWGGAVIREKVWEPGSAYGAEVIEVAYGWPDIRRLRNALAGIN